MTIKFSDSLAAKACVIVSLLYVNLYIYEFNDNILLYFLIRNIMAVSLVVEK